MTLTPELIVWLQSDEAAIWLEPLTAHPPGDSDLLQTLTHLRKALPADHASALVQTAQLRQQAKKKFIDAERMFFAKEPLQQASASIVACHTARRYAHSTYVADLGCGLGGDSLALAAAGHRVLSVDHSALNLSLVAANARALNLTSCVQPLRADVQLPAWRCHAAWADPGRRAGRRRIFDPEQLQPALSSLLAQRRRYEGGLGVKLMPGLAHEAIPPDAEAEWISVRGDLKQCVLWFGELARDRKRRATLLPSGEELDAGGAQADVRPPGHYLYEPDPAVIRAGAVSDLALALGLWQIDPTIAYLSADDLVPSRFARHWRILEHHPFDLKHLNRRLRVLQGQVLAVKKRGSPIDPEAFRRRLYHHAKGQPLVIVITRALAKPWMLICSPESYINR